MLYTDDGPVPTDAGMVVAVTLLLVINAALATHRNGTTRRPGRLLPVSMGIQTSVVRNFRYILDLLQFSSCIERSLRVAGDLNCNTCKNPACGSQ